MDNEVVGRLFQVSREHLVFTAGSGLVTSYRMKQADEGSSVTICVGCQFDNIADSNVNDAEKSLILLLELLLVKYLDGENGVFIHVAVVCQR